MMPKLTLITLIFCTILWGMTIDEAQVLTIDGKFTEALTGLAATLNQETSAKKRFLLSLEIGDIYLDKLQNYAAAESVYTEMIKAFPKSPDLGEVYYRLGISYEREERFVDAANAYQTVVIHYPKSKFADDASNAIERCFKKNYRELVALVDSFPITRLEYDERLSNLPEQARTDTAQTHKLLWDMINERLLLNAALKAGVLDRPDVKSQLADARKSITFRELYQRAILDRVIVNPKELKPYYKSHIKDFTIPEQVRARQITLKTHEEADSVLTTLKTGKIPFDSLAKLYSIDPSKTQGGDMGFFARGRNPAQIDSVAFRLKPGELSGIIETDKGFTILKVEDRRPATKKKFKDVKDDIKNRLEREKRDTIYKQYMADLKKSVTIDTFALDKDTLALVGNHPITKEDLDRAMAKIPPFARDNYKTPEGKRQLIDQIITERLLTARVESGKHWLPDSVGIQLSAARKTILTRALQIQETTEKIKIDSVQIEQYYKTHQADYKLPEQVRAREIMVKTEDEAKTVLKRLKTVSFDSLAKEVSIAPDKQQGGDMGFFSRGEKPKEIEEAAFKLKPGQVSGIIPEKDGFVIIKVEERKKASTKPLSEVKNEIEWKLRTQEQQQLWNSYIENLKQSAKIEILLTEEPGEKTGE